MSLLPPVACRLLKAIRTGRNSPLYYSYSLRRRANDRNISSEIFFQRHLCWYTKLQTRAYLFSSPRRGHLTTNSYFFQSPNGWYRFLSRVNTFCKHKDLERSQSWLNKEREYFSIVGLLQRERFMIWLKVSWITCIINFYLLLSIFHMTVGLGSPCKWLVVTRALEIILLGPLKCRFQLFPARANDFYQ